MAHSSEGTEFAIALTPEGHLEYYKAELILNARETTEVTISTATGTDVVTVHGNWSLHYDLPYALRTINDIEDKG